MAGGTARRSSFLQRRGADGQRRRPPINLIRIRFEAPRPAQNLDGRNPNATERELLKLFINAAKDDPEALDVIVKEVARRLLAH
jgi:hypothetical protein